MMTTEQISKMPYCPFALGGPVADFRCVGNRCMAWKEPFFCKRLEGFPNPSTRLMISRAQFPKDKTNTEKGAAGNEV